MKTILKFVSKLEKFFKVMCFAPIKIICFIEGLFKLALPSA